MDAEEKKRKVKQIIQENLYMVLATTAKDEPWISPIFYAVDENYTFYCTLEKMQSIQKILRKIRT